jgi:hypothetical protein
VAVPCSQGVSIRARDVKHNKYRSVIAASYSMVGYDIIARSTLPVVDRACNFEPEVGSITCNASTPAIS